MSSPSAQIGDNRRLAADAPPRRFVFILNKNGGAGAVAPPVLFKIKTQTGVLLEGIGFPSHKPQKREAYSITASRLAAVHKELRSRAQKYFSGRVYGRPDRQDKSLGLYSLR